MVALPLVRPRQHQLKMTNVIIVPDKPTNRDDQEDTQQLPQHTSAGMTQIMSDAHRPQPPRDDARMDEFTPLPEHMPLPGAPPPSTKTWAQVAMTNLRKKSAPPDGGAFLASEPVHRKARARGEAPTKHPPDGGDQHRPAPLDRPGAAAAIASKPSAPTGWQGPLCAPRDDLITEAQARALHAELLAGHEQPEGIPRWALDKLDLADTGCGTSFGNRREIFESIYLCEADVNGAAGSFITREKGTMRNPLMDTNGNLGIFREHNAILHEACAYTLIAVGRASREQGLSLWMPPHGTDGYMQFATGVRVTLLNRQVLVVRPIGYKISPESRLSCLALSARTSLGVPKSGDYFVYLCSNVPREGDLPSAMANACNCGAVTIDTRIGGDDHDLRKEPVVTALCVLRQTIW